MRHAGARLPHAGARLPHAGAPCASQLATRGRTLPHAGAPCALHLATRGSTLRIAPCDTREHLATRGSTLRAACVTRGAPARCRVRPHVARWQSIRFPMGHQAPARRRTATARPGVVTASPLRLDITPCGSTLPHAGALCHTRVHSARRMRDATCARMRQSAPAGREVGHSSRSRMGDHDAAHVPPPHVAARPKTPPPPAPPRRIPRPAVSPTSPCPSPAVQPASASPAPPCPSPAAPRLAVSPLAVPQPRRAPAARCRLRPLSPASISLQVLELSTYAEPSTFSGSDRRPRRFRTMVEA